MPELVFCYKCSQNREPHEMTYVMTKRGKRIICIHCKARRSRSPFYLRGAVKPDPK